ncbi:MAG: T9SS type A sorting domain-containing protein [Candidatus Eisenbacteria bacterium]|nr:T9SS type A sorting domain-containing protein [Candidatus Eisenbacteria bacterium]
MSAARPNPSAGRATFAVALPALGDVDLAIYDLAGRRVATLWRGTLAAGEREFAWDGTHAKSGVYFARLVVDGEVRSTRVVLRRDR